MAKYDYEEGKKRVSAILNDENEIEKRDKVPSSDNFTYHNGYYSNVTAVFVDIKDSTALFGENRKKSTSKIIRAFSSEIIEILKDDSNLREIGIRGDCVYAIYTCSSVKENVEIMDKVFYINTYMKMLNKLLSNKGMRNIKAGIGVATAKELVVKAGREGSGINNLVWIGKAVTHASKFSGEANRNGMGKIIFSGSFYNIIIDSFVKKNIDIKPSECFKFHNDEELGTYYSCGVVKKAFSDWIDKDMK